MLDDEVAEIVANLRLLGADDTDVEAKRAERVLPTSLRATLSAFSNTGGGVVLLGLDEASGFAATGVRDAAKTAADLASWCSTDMEPPLRPLVRVHQFEGVHLVVAEVPEIEPSRKPCYYRGAGITQGSYVRVHDGDRRLTSYEVQILLAKHGQPRDDEEAVHGTTTADLEPRLLAEFLGRLRQTRPYGFAELDDQAALRRVKVLVGPDDALSLGGLLALGRFPQAHHPQLMMTFVHYPTPDGADVTSGERFVDNVVVEGSIPVIVRDALAVLRRNMSRRAVVRGAGREDVWDYPEAALREVIVNALVHRDLSPASRGTQCQIELYPDRMVVGNPGGLFGPVTVDQLGEDGVSSARNATLMQVLEDVPIPGTTRTVCENRGSGVRTMINALRRAGMSAPDFRDRIGTFSVTFPHHSLLSDETIAWIESLSQVGLTDNQCTALALLRDGASLDNSSYRRVTGVDSQDARRELRDLVARGVAVQVGSNRWTRYRLATASPPPAVIPRADRREQLMTELQSGPLSRGELQRRTGLGAAAVRRWLSILRDEGAIEPTERAVRSPNTRYRLPARPDRPGDFTEGDRT